MLAPLLLALGGKNIHRHLADDSANRTRTMLRRSNLQADVQRSRRLCSGYTQRAVSCAFELSPSLHCESLHMMAPLTDPQSTVYNNLTANCYQCRLDSEYSPIGFGAKSSPDSTSYAFDLELLTRFSDTCEARNMTLVGTKALTEPPLWVCFLTPLSHISKLTAPVLLALLQTMSAAHAPARPSAPTSRPSPTSTSPPRGQWAIASSTTGTRTRSGAGTWTTSAG